MNTADLPQSICEEIVQIAPDFSIIVDILDDGRRVIRQEQIDKLFQYMEKL